MKFEQPLVNLVAAVDQFPRYFIRKNALICLLASNYILLLLTIACFGVTVLERSLIVITCHQLGHFGGVKHLVAIQ